MRILVRRVLHPAAAVALAVSAAATACSDDTAVGTGIPTAVQTTAATERGGTLPPTDLAALQALFDPRFDALDLHVTRGSVASLEGGDHLALYVEPAGDADVTAEGYADRVMPSLAAMLPELFDTFPGLASFDLCQEPPAAVDDTETPPPETLVLLTREQVLSVDDWSTLSIAELIELAATDGGGGTVSASDAVGATTMWQSAVADAERDD